MMPLILEAVPLFEFLGDMFVFLVVTFSFATFLETAFVLVQCKLKSALFRSWDVVDTKSGLSVSDLLLIILAVILSLIESLLSLLLLFKSLLLGLNAEPFCSLLPLLLVLLKLLDHLLGVHGGCLSSAPEPLGSDHLLLLEGELTHKLWRNI